MIERAIWSEAQEIAVYRPGQKVEVKSRSGIVDTVIAYDPDMVPPVVLANDPQPRYPEELTLISQPRTSFNWLLPWSKPNKVNNSAQKVISSH
ncbi:hypothetical protein [Chamaesiphon minutus]|uniref:Uncharacterized protein n=1 Tax=Chamaesiphon minutus (strain ATCC 27169 / PCC 6605) TaxID=1173020 RepID=K9UGF9_CHAP6|nr:hypothetical protein [Chamaesiphon minutus]AFY93895.1 hypothetical protein Cha6605_2859 [Chamaesiphon minutus PCC 6605]